MQEEAPLHKHKHSANEQLAQSGTRCAFLPSLLCQETLPDPGDTTKPRDLPVNGMLLR